MNVTPIPKEEWEEFKRRLAENKQKSLERCARVKKVRTNGDKIRAMDDKELAEFLKLVDFGLNYPGDKTWLGWLKSPVEVDNG